MEIHTWFPLAVATHDLAPPPASKADMLAELAPFVAQAEQQQRPDFAWTGDVNGCGDLHRRPAFAWLRGEVERDVRAFVLALGGGKPHERLWFQASWPVLSLAAETVASHTHLTASVSAVYYLEVPAGSGGTLVFENWGRSNALAPGFGEAGDPNTAAPNALNATEACYAPQEGRLVLFPARQPHFVRAHGAAELRIAITFDIGLTPHGPDRPDPAPDARDWFAPAQPTPS